MTAGALPLASSHDRQDSALLLSHTVEPHFNYSTMWRLCMMLLSILSLASAFSRDDFLTQVKPLFSADSRLDEFARTLVGKAEFTLAPGQECDAPFPGLSAKPFHNTEEFEFSAMLQQEWKTVADELQQFLNARKESNVDDAWAQSVTKLCDDTNGFSKLTIMDEQGNVCTPYFHKTLKLISRIKNLAPRPVCINRQSPGTGLAPHSDNMNFLLTCHLGLVIPAKCLFINGGVEKEWREGKVLVADTSFVHSTVNNSNQDRYVLSFAVWHPHLTRDEQEGIIQIHDLLRDLEGSNDT